MEKIITHADVSDKLDVLIEIIYEEDYFNIKENAKQYITNIYEFINTIPQRPHSLNKNKKLGSYFVLTNPIDALFGIFPSIWKVAFI